MFAPLKALSYNQTKKLEYVRLCCSSLLSITIGILSIIISSSFSCNDESTIVDSNVYLDISGVLSVIDPLCMSIFFGYIQCKNSKMWHQVKHKKADSVEHILFCTLWLSWDIAWIVIGMIIWWELSLNCQESTIGMLILINIAFKMIFGALRIVCIGFAAMFVVASPVDAFVKNSSLLDINDDDRSMR